MSVIEEAATARRDFRHDHGTSEVPPVRGKRNRKVCKKNKGGSHEYAPKARFGMDSIQWDACIHCGKYATKVSSR